MAQTPHVKQLCIPPKVIVPQKTNKKVINKKFGESHRTFSRSFGNFGKQGTKTGVFSPFSAPLPGGVLSPPNLRHAENAAALLENVRGTQGFGFIWWCLLVLRVGLDDELLHDIFTMVVFGMTITILGDYCCCCCWCCCRCCCFFESELFDHRV